MRPNAAGEEVDEAADELDVVDEVALDMADIFDELEAICDAVDAEEAFDDIEDFELLIALDTASELFAELELEVCVLLLSEPPHAVKPVINETISMDEIFINSSYIASRKLNADPMGWQLSKST